MNGDIRNRKGRYENKVQYRPMNNSWRLMMENNVQKLRPLRVLMVTGIYPTERKPHAGTFIQSQVDSLIEEGVEVEVIHPRPGPMPLRYAYAVWQVFRKTLRGQFDIVHG